MKIRPTESQTRCFGLRRGDRGGHRSAPSCWEAQREVGGQNGGPNLRRGNLLRPIRAAARSVETERDGSAGTHRTRPRLPPSSAAAGSAYRENTPRKSAGAKSEPAAPCLRAAPRRPEASAVQRGRNAPLRDGQCVPPPTNMKKHNIMKTEQTIFCRRTRTKISQSEHFNLDPVILVTSLPHRPQTFNAQIGMICVPGSAPACAAPGAFLPCGSGSRAPRSC